MRKEKVKHFFDDSAFLNLPGLGKLKFQNMIC